MSAPYYSDDYVTLYHGDALEIMPSLGDFDLVLTSPRYNKGETPWAVLGHWKPGNASGSGGRGAWRSGVHGGSGADYDEVDDSTPWPEYVEEQHRAVRMMWERLTDVGAIFYQHQARTIGTRLWRPDELIPPELTIRGEVIWARGSGFNATGVTYLPTCERILVVAREGWRLPKGHRGAHDVWTIRPETNTEHPAPFPLRLAARAINTTEASTVLDPFAGSGTTLMAAKAAGVRATGIELSERYCEIAARRLSQEVLDFGGAA